MRILSSREAGPEDQQLAAVSGERGQHQKAGASADLSAHVPYSSRSLDPAFISLIERPAPPSNPRLPIKYHYV